ncbi:MAG: tRNA (adenosine(37)-N6)-threonylcarbamoyltransferase complex ATPase subunit type 1 TsaE [Candidatus Moranbacteria bacterium CG_4_9_14_3_um_filter_40_7]|nr:MAG: tRNA (adenosine(37)-N6)-threonylcarbamoyltransferase complex ATPase subunit type 1 TsaE [Candidatus Moranbacteria bacterium CG23_combo_of_CG06-09_8_20_14_all_40_16]PIU80946.1 MAG: tRNA (adenosine(37)-N6)-threonylcarbamoyltransferase complex ATPase subunit type 1 TsaE [Candidatus Moranbacteria bacterium CG06_land_8_20_14_3_00_40_12]PJA87907.1 MAG: tRNA (adenosine(37)-N6)-threonylcarbamoyltransferase complex ATPase subunit type 1 TsaE [Candidatus Moranbacteria bacterium CG_4_9_14_3_um_filte
MQTIITQNFQATRKLGRELAKKIKAGQIICLSGDLGSGKTTLAQGLLKGLGAKGPYTSPTFLIIKNYKKEIPISKSQFPNKSKIQNPKSKTLNIYHIDVYRVNEKDILNLGWEEIIKDKNNIIVIEWAERIKKIIPAGAKWIKFSWEGEKKRKINLHF